MHFRPGPFSACGGLARVLDLPPTFGLVLPLLRQIGIAKLVDQHCKIRSDALMTHGEVVEALLLQILHDNRRWPLYKMSEWAQQHNLHALYDIDATSLEDRRIAHGLDCVEPFIEQLHTAIVNRIITLYNLPVRAVLWDLTHVSFEGAYEASELIEAGYGHGHIQEKQLKVSLHADAETALPLMYEVLAGATNQTPLAEGYLQDLRRRLQRSDLIVVSDKAGISYDNIAAYLRHSGQFLGPLQTTPAEEAQIKAVAQEAFSELQYRSKSKPDEVFMCHPTTVTFQRQKHRTPLQVAALVIYSSQKHKDDRKRRNKDIQTTLAQLEKTAGYLNKGRYVSGSYALEQLPKKIKGGAQGIVTYELTGEDKHLSLRYWVDQQALAEAQRSDGRYMLVHNLTGSPDEIFALYKSQHLVERCFRSFNSDLKVKPLWLHKDQRIKAMVFIWIIALTVFTLLGILAERAMLDNEPYYHKLTSRSMLEHFQRASLIEITMPGHPPEFQLQLSDRMVEILEALGLHDPHKLLIIS